MSPRVSPWPWAVGALLAAVVGVNLYVLQLARRNAPVIAEEGYYQLGVAHQGRIDARRAARALGWRAEYSWAPDRLTLTLTDPEGRGVEGLAGALALRRADTALEDAAPPLAPLGAGRYEALLPPGRGGLYSFRVWLRGARGAWEDEGRARRAPRPAGSAGAAGAAGATR